MFRTLFYRSLCLLLALPASTVLAADLNCGSYRNSEGGEQLRILSATHAVLQRDGQPDTAYLLRKQGHTLEVADLNFGVMDSFTLSKDGKTLQQSFGKYVLDTAATCNTPPPPPANSCRADIKACFDAAYEAPADKLRQWCAEDLPFACDRLITSYRTQAQQAAESDATQLDLPEEPAVCKQGTPTYDANACKAEATKVVGALMAKAMASAFGPDQPLATPQLNDLQSLCQAHPGGGFCGKVAKEFWTAGHYLAARDMLRLACTAGGESDACPQADALAALTTSQVNAAPLRSLPCGQYSSTMGLMSEFAFEDHGIIVTPGSRMRARLEQGLVHIRHDKGGDFVLKSLGDGRLLGLDEWTRYAVYQRNGANQQCKAPVAYVEIPMPADCPLGGDPQACCAAGKLQGCNALGHSKALAGRWLEAAPPYQTVCTAGVRAGCENLRSVYGNTGDQTIIDTLKTICARDKKGTHVACDIHDSTDWETLGATAALTQLGNALEAELDAETPKAKTSKKSPDHP